MDWDSIALTMLAWITYFSTVFLGIFIEAVPFLLLGTLASGLVEVFIDRETLARWFPRNRWGSLLMGSLLGLFFPVGECGVLPLARRLMRKGLPVSSAIAFLLAAPVINPIALAGTYVAFGLGTIFWGRLGLTLLVALATGLVFSLEGQPERLVRLEAALSEPECLPESPSTFRRRWTRALLIAGEEFFEMGRYLVPGALLAAGLQTFIPQTALTGVGKGSILAVPALEALAALLSNSSMVDAFVALAFVGTFSAGPILAFLVYGPMVDIKAVLMLQRVFRPKTVVYLVAIPFFLTAVAAGIFMLAGGG